MQVFEYGYPDRNGSVSGPKWEDSLANYENKKSKGTCGGANLVLTGKVRDVSALDWFDNYICISVNTKKRRIGFSYYDHNEEAYVDFLFSPSELIEFAQELEAMGRELLEDDK